jgi:putative ABC transport system permease protein
MFKNYFTIISRNLWRNKLYTLINVIGLGVGIASLVWGIQDYRFSFSFDDFQKDKTNIFRVLTKNDAGDYLNGICPAALAQAAKSDFPSVKGAVRWESRALNIKAGQDEPFASRVNFTDAGFFDFFNFPLLKGSANLNDPSAVLLTEESAKKLFGKTDPIGKTLLFYADQPYRKPLTVTGILKDAPVNSSIQFDIITSTGNRLKPDGSIIKDDDWSWFSQAVFLKLSSPAESAALINGFKKYLPLEQSVRRDFRLTAFAMEPLSQVASHTSGKEIQSNGLYTRPQDSAAYGPLVLAILILLSACLNFANTSVAQSNRRLKEIGVRKVMGSSYRQIMIQQLLECAFVVLLAVIFSVVINNYC